MLSEFLNTNSKICATFAEIQNFLWDCYLLVHPVYPDANISTIISNKFHKLLMLSCRKPHN